MEETPDERGRDRILELLHGISCTGLTAVIASLNIADLLAHGPASAETLAAQTGSHFPTLYRVLRAAATIGLLHEHASTFSLTDAGYFLRSDVHGSLRAVAVMAGSDISWRVNGALLHMVRTGQNAFEHVFGRPYFDYLSQNPEASRMFGEAMYAWLAPQLDAILFTLSARFDLTPRARVVDVGGGTGGLIGGLLSLVPELHGVLFDMPSVMSEARHRLAQLGVADRCTFVGGSFFEAVPENGDLYLMRSVLHDWDDTHALKYCKHAVRPSPPRERRPLRLSSLSR